MRAVVTGGCGFIGSHVTRALLADGWEVTNLDALTYAGNPLNLGDAATHPGYTFVHGDICDTALVRSTIAGADLVLNFAAETHVDRSLMGPAAFVRTDVEGVVSLLEALRDEPRAAFVHMSTDEVFGEVAEPDEAAEDRPFAPASPYSASKAAAELQVRAYSQSYGMPATIIRACNVYGPNQHVEKFIPLFITRAMAGEALPLYGDGRQQREWLYVDDLTAAVCAVIAGVHREGIRAIHAGSGERVANIDVARAICSLNKRPMSLIRPVQDRPGHDRRYALDSARLRSLGWEPKVPMKDGLRRTVQWYREHPEIWGAATSGDGFAGYFAEQYADRLAKA